MATLILPYPAFTAGTPAVAAEVQDNFTTIRDHINGQNIGTANIETTLVSRVGGPILFLNQASQEQIALSILNSRTKSALQITQSAVLGAGSSIIAIDDNATQTTGDAQLYINTQTGSTIPAIKVNHGSDVTMSLTKTQLDLFNSAVQATSAGVVSMTTANLTTVNATTVAATDVNTTNVTATGLLDLTAPASDAIVAEIKGRSGDNNAIVQFKSNDDATVYASATSSDSGLVLNLPDTADSYTFKVNDVTKAVIDNNGIGGQLKSTGFVYSGSDVFTPPSNGTFSVVRVLGSFDITNNCNLLLTWRNISTNSTVQTTGNVGTILYVRIIVEGPSGFSVAFSDNNTIFSPCYCFIRNSGPTTMESLSGLNCVSNGTYLGLNLTSIVALTGGAGTYTVKLEASGNNIANPSYSLNNFLYSGNLIY